MRLLLINPNTSEHITSRLHDTVVAVVGDAGEVRAVTAANGPAVIGSRTESAIAAASVLELAAAHADGVDAIVLGVSLDSGLAAVRELMEVPVTAVTEAGLLSASMLGQRIGLLTVGPSLLPAYRELAVAYGIAARVCSWRALEAADAFGAERDDARLHASLAGAIETMVAEDTVEAVVLSGAVLAGCATAIRERVPVPVVDGVQAAALQAVALARLGCRSARTGSLCAPRARPSRGLGPALEARLRRD